MYACMHVCPSVRLLRYIYEQLDCIFVFANRHMCMDACCYPKVCVLPAWRFIEGLCIHIENKSTVPVVHSDYPLSFLHVHIMVSFQSALGELGLSSEERLNIWRIIAAVLLLGQLELQEDSRNQAYLENDIGKTQDYRGSKGNRKGMER